MGSRDDAKALAEGQRAARRLTREAGRPTPQANPQDSPLAAGRIDKASDRLANVLPVEIPEMTTALEEVCAIGE